MPLLLAKLAGSVLVAIAMLYPLATPEGRAGVLASVSALGWGTAAAIVAAFLIGIALYCRSLQACLTRIAPANRAMAPRAVWLMFVPFYNIIEDFFIIRGVTTSIRAEAAINPRLAGFTRFGAVSGYGWAVAQVLALVPSRLGEAASVIALALWLWHWWFIARVMRALRAEEAPQLR